MAEWSNALFLASDSADGMSSNPTSVNQILPLYSSFDIHSFFISITYFWTEPEGNQWGVLGVKCPLVCKNLPAQSDIKTVISAAKLKKTGLLEAASGSDGLCWSKVGAACHLDSK